MSDGANLFVLAQADTDLFFRVICQKQNGRSHRGTAAASRRYALEVVGFSHCLCARVGSFLNSHGLAFCGIVKGIQKLKSVLNRTDNGAEYR
jgi:hypothetical protein